MIVLHEVLAASRKTWKSPAYEHYTISLRRNETSAGEKLLYFVFKCKFDNASHPTISRPRSNTSWGTSNLINANKKCDSTRAVQPDASGSNSLSSADSNGPVPFSNAAFRALIALRSAASNRAFNEVKDPFFIQCIELLRPGTRVPSPSTVSDDVKFLHAKMCERVAEYFEVRTSRFILPPLINHAYVETRARSPCCN